MAQARLGLIFVLGIFVYLIFSPSEAFAATRTWDGGGSTNDWSEDANWSSDTEPTSSDDVVFNNTSDKVSTVDAAFTGTVISVSINSGYDGTITMARSLTTSGTFTASSGNFTAADQTLTVTTTFTMNTGSNFTASSGTTNFSGAFTINGGTFSHNNGVANFNGGSATLTCGTATFFSVTFNNTGTKTVGATCDMPLGNNPTVGSSITLNGELIGSGNLSSSVTNARLTLNSGYALTGFSGLVFELLTVNTPADFTNYNPFTLTAIANSNLVQNAGVLTLPDGAVITSTFNIISNGVLNAPVGGTFTVKSTFGLDTGGAFNHNNSTVISYSNNSGQKNLNGGLTFYNLSILALDSTTPNIRGFDERNNVTTTILGTLIIRDTTIRTTLNSGPQAKIDPQGPTIINNVDVKDSNNINSATIICTNCINSGNNTNWIFPGSIQSFALDYPGGNENIIQTLVNPTLRWRKGTSRANISKYQLYIQPKTNDSIQQNTGQPLFIDNIVPSVTNNANTNNTLTYPTYTIHDDGEYLNLNIDVNYYKIPLGGINWRIVATDNVGNTQEDYIDFMMVSPNEIVSFAPQFPNSSSWFPLQINSITGTNIGRISSFMSLKQNSFNLNFSKPTISGIAFANSTVTVLVTDTNKGISSTFTTKTLPNSRWTIIPHITSTSIVDVWVNLDGQFNRVPPFRLTPIASQRIN